MVRDRAPLPADPALCPSLPRDAIARFDDGCAALGIAPLPGEAREAILGHLRLLLAWTASVNLTAIRDPGAAVTGHLLDSLAALPYLREFGVRRLVDLGSGGGYPGLPLALALPAERALLVDSIAKKAAFLKVAVRAAGADRSVAVATVRGEALAADRHHRERWPAVTVRAVAPLPELVELAFPLLAPGGILVAWKRAPIDDELARAIPAIAALGGGVVDVVVPPRSVPGLATTFSSSFTRRAAPATAGPGPPAERRRRPW